MKIYALDRRQGVAPGNAAEALKGAANGREFRYTCSRHEYFVVQLVLEPKYSRRGMSVETSALRSASGGKDIDRVVTCFNTSGILPDGEKYTKTIDLEEGVLQPLYFGINFIKADEREYYTEINIGGDIVRLDFELNDDLVFGMGTTDGGRLSRLKWLDSSVCRDKKPLGFFEEVTVEKNAVRLTGKTVSFGNDGFIEQVDSYFDGSNAVTDEPTKQLFSRPMEFIVEGQKFKYNKLRAQTRAGAAAISADGKSERLRIDVAATVRYEGAVHYTVNVHADKNAVLNDASLYLYFASAGYVAGLGEEGGAYRDISFKWDGRTASDSLFVGDVNCGARIRFTEGDPLPPAPMNLYSPEMAKAPEKTWANHSLGGVELYRADDSVVMRAYTGQIVMKQGEDLKFTFIIHLTPFRPMDPGKSLGARIAESDIEPSYASMIRRASSDAAGYVSVSAHGEANPYRNYPFDKYRELEDIALEAHKHKIGMTLDYDAGSLSVHARETFAFRSMGGEIIYLRQRKQKENALGSVLGKGVVVCEDAMTAGGERDMAYLTVPGSRMDNFFVEGVRFLTSRTAADGVSLTDTPILRDTAERAAKCIERTAGKRAVMELKYSSRFNKENGYVSAAVMYADILPFVTRLWAVSGFPEDIGADKELLEMSGVFFGLAADSPENWGIMRSLAFASLPRYGKDPDVSAALGDIQRLFKDFGISKAKLRGFWDPENPVRTDNANVLATSFVNGENMLFVLYNMSDGALTFEVGVENKLGFTTAGKKTFAPKIEGLQRSGRVNIGKPMRLKGKSGILVFVRK